MSKSILVFETPCNCLECMFMRRSDDIPTDKPFTYQRLYNCILEPEHYNDDEERYIDFLNDYIVMSIKPDWCPLKKLPDKKHIDPGYYLSPQEWEKGYNKCLDEIGG